MVPLRDQSNDASSDASPCYLKCSALRHQAECGDSAVHVPVAMPMHGLCIAIRDPGYGTPRGLMDSVAGGVDMFRAGIGKDDERDLGICLRLRLTLLLLLFCC